MIKEKKIAEPWSKSRLTNDGYQPILEGYQPSGKPINIKNPPTGSAALSPAPSNTGQVKISKNTASSQLVPKKEGKK